MLSGMMNSIGNEIYLREINIEYLRRYLRGINI